VDATTSTSSWAEWRVARCLIRSRSLHTLFVNHDIPRPHGSFLVSAIYVVLPGLARSYRYRRPMTMTLCQNLHACSGSIDRLILKRTFQRYLEGQRIVCHDFPFIPPRNIPLGFLVIVLFRELLPILSIQISATRVPRSYKE